MRVARTLEQLAAARAASPGRVALVPTMGALHEGHLSLLAAARRCADTVAASIFVNPTQFGPGEDLARYPRDEAGDLDALRSAGCDLAWLPDVATMYPAGGGTTIEVAGVSARWEGAARPGHFRGVATVVAKLFGQVRPDAAVFGEKDWQQLQVVRRMVADLNLGVRVVGVATARSEDGLALSSRNRFLAPEERRQAARLPEALREAARRLGDGEPAAAVLGQARDGLAGCGFDVDYLAQVHPETLEPIDEARRPGRLIAAARLGSVRLLDNVAVS